MSASPRRLLVKNIGHLVTMNPAREILRGAWLTAENGFITGYGTGTPPPDLASSSSDSPLTVHDACGGIATPGLINTHHHFYQTMARAYTPGNNLPLLPWLAHMNKLWKPFTSDDLYVASKLALAEMMLTGCTTAADHHYVVPAGSGDNFAAQFRAAADLGVRFHCARGSMDVHSPLIGPWAVQTADEIMADVVRLHRDFHDPAPGSFRQIFLAPCAATSASKPLLVESARYAREHGLGLHSHCAETVEEDAFSLEKFNMRPLEYFADCGWDFEGVWFAHGIHFTDTEVKWLGDRRIGVAHCPYANMRLGSGICRVGDLQRAGAKVAIGVDGSASNDSGHVLGELRQALMLARVRYGAGAMSALDAIALGTTGGADLLRRHDLGSLTVGRCADLAIFPEIDLHSSGCENPVDALLICWSRQVESLIVGGEVRIAGGRFLDHDLDALIADHTSRARRIHAALGT
jgi:8-oxoguanine deaminase